MKEIIASVSLLMLCITLNSNAASAQQDTLSGTWEGLFMEKYRIFIHFQAAGSNTYLGRLKMYDNNQQIQDDQLENIQFRNGRMEFYIPAKQTPYQGILLSGTNEIDGKFTFPDGSEHWLKISKIADLPKGERTQGDNIFALTYDRSVLLSDVCFLADKLETLHPTPYAWQDQREIGNLLDWDIEEPGTGETLVEFYLTASAITDAIGCSHTGVKLPDEALASLKECGHYFPLKLFFSDQRAWVVSCTDKEEHIIPGMEILSINGKSIQDIIRELFVCFPAEKGSLSAKYYALNNSFQDYFILLDNSGLFKVNFKTAGNELACTIISACSYDDLTTGPAEIRPGMASSKSASYSIYPEENMALLTIPAFVSPDINAYIHFMDSVFLDLSQRDMRNLVIDLRGNAGGHPIFAAQLYSYLADTAFRYFDPQQPVDELAPLYDYLPNSGIHFSGMSFVLVDGGCLSTTGHLISLLKYHGISTIVGDEPGSGYRCADMSRQFTLPGTGLELNVATHVFQTAVEGFDRETEMVDIPVRRGIEDILFDQDPCMTTVKSSLQGTADRNP